MRFQAIFPALCAFVAFVLGFVVVFAGNKPNYLEKCHILTLNTSRIAVDIFNTTFSAPSGTDDDSTFESYLNQAEAEASNFTNHVQSELESDLNSSIQSIAKDLGLYDFYSLHILDHCQGYYKRDSSKNVISCSNATAFSVFSPTHTLQRQLNASGTGLSLEMDLRWPSAITEALDGLKLAFHAVFALYALGIACAGLSFLGSLAGIFLMDPSDGSRGKLVALANAGIAQTAFFALLVASAIVNGGADKAVEVVNEYGADISISARKGHTLIAMSWAATVLLFVAGLAWFVEWYLEKRRRGLMPKQLQ